MKLKNTLLVALLGLAFALPLAGTFHILSAQQNFWVSTATGIALIFWWYRVDSEEVGYLRSPGLTVAIVALAIVAVPIYLYRSRPEGRKARALGGFALYGVAYILSGVSGAVLGTVIKHAL